MKMARFPRELKDAIGRDKFILMDMYRKIEELWPTHLLSHECDDRDQIEQFAIERLGALGYVYQHGPAFEHDREQPGASYEQVLPVPCRGG